MKYELKILRNGNVITENFEGDAESLLEMIERMECDPSGGFVTGIKDERGQEYVRIVAGKPVA